MKKYNKRIGLDRLKYLLNYNSITGIFTWNNSPNIAIKHGRVAGTFNVGGYINIQLDGHMYRAHRLAWLHFYGRWPKHDLDHRDTVRRNNWISNLREATRSQNCINQRMRKDNTSGYKGVSKIRGRYQAVVTLNKKRVFAKTFKTKEEAYAAYCKKAKEFYGEFANLGDKK